MSKDIPDGMPPQTMSDWSVTAGIIRSKVISKLKSQHFLFFFFFNCVIPVDFFTVITVYVYSIYLIFLHFISSPIPNIFSWHQWRLFLLSASQASRFGTGFTGSEVGFCTFPGMEQFCGVIGTFEDWDNHVPFFTL